MKKQEQQEIIEYNDYYFYIITFDDNNLEYCAYIYKKPDVKNSIQKFTSETERGVKEQSEKFIDSL